MTRNFLFFFLWIIFFLSPIKSNLDLSLSLEYERYFLGEWLINQVSLDGKALYIPKSNIEFSPTHYKGNIGCIVFWGETRILSQNALTLIPIKTNLNRCPAYTDSQDTSFLPYFLGTFFLEIPKKLFWNRDIPNYIILKNNRLTIWLSKF